MSNDAQKAFRALVELISSHSPCCVAFSGGVDSSVVALAAYHASKDSVAVTAVSELCTRTEAEEARRIAGSIGIDFVTVELGLLEDGAVADNPPDRCYICKKAVIRAMKGLADGRGIRCLLDGSNAGDAGSYRPGMKALAELGVVSPLLELGIDKPLVREIAHAMGLPNHDRPSAPCLATRFPYGVRLTEPGLRRVREAEEYVRSLGFTEFRVRDHDGLARIELLQDDIKRVIEGGLYKKIVAKLTALGYNYVTLDLQGFRSGSMDVRLQ